MMKKERNGQGVEGCSWECQAVTVVGGGGRRRDCDEGGAPASDQDPSAVGASGVAALSVRLGRGKH
jgi:hypothetical protein